MTLHENVTSFILDAYTNVTKIENALMPLNVIALGNKAR